MYFQYWTKSRVILAKWNFVNQATQMRCSSTRIRCAEPIVNGLWSPVSPMELLHTSNGSSIPTLLVSDLCRRFRADVVFLICMICLIYCHSWEPNHPHDMTSTCFLCRGSVLHRSCAASSQRQLGDYEYMRYMRYMRYMMYTMCMRYMRYMMDMMDMMDMMYSSI